MCGRYVIQSNWEGWSDQLPLTIHSLFDFNPSWNAAPSQVLPVLMGAGEDEANIVGMYWGLIPSWTKPGEKPKMTPINARSETVAEKPMFRGLLKRYRCVVPADGFYEWKRTADGKEPYFIHSADKDAPLWFAGLTGGKTEKNGEEYRSFTILTTSPNSKMEELHDRMPVILSAKDVEAWLDPDDEDFGHLEHLLVPAPDEAIDVYPVSKAVNNTRNNGPELIEPDE